MKQSKWLLVILIAVFLGACARDYPRRPPPPGAAARHCPCYGDIDCYGPRGGRFCINARGRRVYR